MIVYTIGHEKSYDAGLLQDSSMMKIGQKKLENNDEEDYEGGIIWKTALEAQEFINTSNLNFKAAVYSVEIYSLEKDITADVYPDGAYRLLNDSKIIEKC